MPKERKMPVKRRRQTKPKKEKISTLRNRAWKFMSLAVRLEEADKHGNCKCCTCNHQMYYYKSECQCGHFRSRKRPATFLERKNLAAQCNICNHPRIGNGEQYVFGLYIDKKYGEGTALSLTNKSRLPYKITREYLEEVITNCAKIIYEQSQAKGLWDWKPGMLKKELELITSQ